MPQTPTSSTVFEPVIGWPAIPHGLAFKEATSVAVGPDDHVYVFNRGRNPLMVFEQSGRFVETWGAGDFQRPHGAYSAPDGDLFLIDDLDHSVKKMTTGGDLIFVLGTPGTPAEWQAGGTFNRPTDAWISPVSGDLFITDGYGNSRVHRFRPDGTHVLSWGEPGTGPGQFSLPHGIIVTKDGRVVVCDRENFRLQVFTEDGEFIQQVHMHRPMAIALGRGDDEAIYVGEAGPPPVQQGVPRLGQRVSVLDSEFNKITHFGADLPGEAPDQFLAPHGIAVDSEGSVYVAEVAYTAYGSLQDPPREVISLRKWSRVSG
ncbi:MAG: peptidylglycine alpha-amidating monooxygenase [Chloroflexi bacterium]|nr:peptidylglycine alpha-amidating monooxygenase [Chloroflexota bacterium]MCH8103688.1 peptidylglycine alpha-amidating monooxygenase [Chloroflexota bacterium]